MTKSKYTDIRSYLLTLMKPHEALGGNAICPYIEKYLQDIVITHHADLESVYDAVPNIVSQQAVAHVMVCEFDWEYFDMQSSLEQFQFLYTQDDMEFLFMHPESEDPPLPIVDYQYDYALIIVQRRSILLKARQQLVKHTDYYERFRAIDK